MLSAQQDVSGWHPVVVYWICDERCLLDATEGAVLRSGSVQIGVAC
jgi:hypothetical protein